MDLESYKFMYTDIMYIRTIMINNRYKHRVFSHAGFWKPVPAESVIHVIEDAFLPSTEVIEFDNLFLGRLVVICKDAAVGVFSFPQVEFAVYPLLSLNHKTVCLPFPFLDENGGQLKLNAAQFHFLPTSEGKDVIVERTASVGTDIEGLAVFSNLFHYLFRTRAAISSETVDNKLVLFKPFKEPLQRVLLVETDICVAVAVALWASFSSQGIAKASFVSALASFVGSQCRQSSRQ